MVDWFFISMTIDERILSIEAIGHADEVVVEIRLGNDVRQTESCRTFNPDPEELYCFLDTDPFDIGAVFRIGRSRIIGCTMTELLEDLEFAAIVINTLDLAFAFADEVIEPEFKLLYIIGSLHRNPGTQLTSFEKNVEVWWCSVLNSSGRIQGYRVFGNDTQALCMSL